MIIKAIGRLGRLAFMIQFYELAQLGYQKG